MSVDLSDLPCPFQDPQEIQWLCDRIEGVESVLEIGSYHGDTLRMFARALKPGGKIRSIDDGFRDHDAAVLAKTIQDLGAAGYDAQWYQSDSRDQAAIDWAKQHGPYDFIFIDGAHDAVVFEDWRNYSPLATKFVGFHDISLSHEHVVKLFAQLKLKYRTEEILIRERYYGIGLVYL